jgi:hypothetical protein
VAQAAEIIGITAEAVRTRIKRDKLDSIKEPPDRTGTVYVLLDVDQTGPNTDPTSQGQDQTTDRTRQDERLVETLREQVAYLQGVIATRDRELEQRAEEIRRRDAALEREQQLTAMFADQLRVIEAPEEPPEDGETVEEALEELGTERARREMAETTMHEGMDEERRRREEAERERDGLRRELFALRGREEVHETAEEQQGRGEPRPATGGAQESSGALRGRGSGTARGSLWRRIFGR